MYVKIIKYILKVRFYGVNRHQEWRNLPGTGIC